MPMPMLYCYPLLFLVVVMHVSILPAVLHTRTLSNFLSLYTVFLFTLNPIQYQSFINATNFRAIYNILIPNISKQTSYFVTQRRRKKNHRKKWIVLYLLSDQECTNAKFNHTIAHCIIVSMSSVLLPRSHTRTLPFGFRNHKFMYIDISMCKFNIYDKKEENSMDHLKTHLLRTHILSEI